MFLFAVRKSGSSTENCIIYKKKSNQNEKLYSQDGKYFSKNRIIDITQSGQKVLMLYQYTLKTGRQSCSDLFYSGWWLNNRIVATTGSVRFPFWHIAKLSEIIENFNQYFNNLNQ